MSVARIKYLFDKWVAQSMTDDERLEFMKLAEIPGNRLLIEDCIEMNLQLAKSDSVLSESATASMLWAVFEAVTVGGEQSAPIPAWRTTMRSRWFSYAAVLLLLVGACVYLWSQFYRAEKDTLARVQVADDLPTSALGAILTLADGSQLVLDSFSNSQLVARQNGANIILDDGQLAYDRATIHKDAGIQYNQLSTPIGRQFRLVLPDGTQVWLNAASSIRYPTVFEGNERLVEVSGEAYFDVKASAGDLRGVPFVVRTNNQRIEVLGTQFNVNAYKNDQDELTTLIEGRIRVKLTSEDNAWAVKTLDAGEQAVIKTTDNEQLHTSSLEVNTKADMESILAWKNGFFRFDKASIPVVMKHLQRWYDIKVIYEDGIPEITFSGDVPRLIPLSQFVEMLTYAGIKVSLDGNLLRIKKS